MDHYEAYQDVLYELGVFSEFVKCRRFLQNVVMNML